MVNKLGDRFFFFRLNGRIPPEGHDESCENCFYVLQFKDFVRLLSERRYFFEETDNNWKKKKKKPCSKKCLLFLPPALCGLAKIWSVTRSLVSTFLALFLFSCEQLSHIFYFLPAPSHAHPPIPIELLISGSPIRKRKFSRKQM